MADYYMYYCPKCVEDRKHMNDNLVLEYRGYNTFTFTTDESRCHVCKGNLIKTKITHGEFSCIQRYSKNRDFIQQMIEMRENNPVEYEFKMDQIRHKIEEREKQNTIPKITPQKIEDNRPKCPRCGSTSITAGARGVSGFWGFIGASKTVNRCANCGHTWKPRG